MNKLKYARKQLRESDYRARHMKTCYLNWLEDPIFQSH